MNIEDRSLSKTHSAFISKLIAKDMLCFSIDDAYKVLHESTPQAVTMLLTKMVRKGWLLRLKKGLYHLIPQDRDPNTFIPNWHITASCLVGDNEFYIGYYSAMEIHSLITQPALIERVVVNKQIKPSMTEIQGVRFQFIYHNPKHFFGFKKHWIDKFKKVLCSDLEKTILDCLYKPQYAGGIVEVAKAIYKAQDELNYERFLNYCYQFGSQSVIKRFGFLIDLYEIKTPITDQLQEMKSTTWTLLDPSHEKNGRMLNKWRIQVNVATETIKQAPHT